MLYGKLKVSSQEKILRCLFSYAPKKLILVVFWKKKGHIYN